MSLKRGASLQVERAAAAITAVPTAVTVAGLRKYSFKVDTSAGDIDFSGLGTAIAGIPNGAVVELIKTTTDANAMQFTDPETTVGYTDFETVGDVMTLEFDSSVPEWRIAG